MTSPDRHTAGPWTAGRPDMATVVDGIDSKWIYAGDRYLAIASSRDCAWPETMANAVLIASAPDLLAAARAAIKAFESRKRIPLFYNCGLSVEDEDALDALRAAVAHATGQSEGAEIDP